MSVDPEAIGVVPVPGTSLDGELAGLRDQIARLLSENARLLRLLELTPVQARPPGATQTGIFDGPPAMVDASSSAAAKIAFFASMFAARSDVHAVHWENARTSWSPRLQIRAADTAQAPVGAVEGLDAGKHGFGQLGDHRVVGVDDVGDRCESRLAHELQGVEVVQPEQ